MVCLFSIVNRCIFSVNRRRKRKLQPPTATTTIIAPEPLQLPPTVPLTLYEKAETPPSPRGAMVQPQILPSMASITFSTTHEAPTDIIETCTNKEGNPFSIDRLIAK